MSNFDTCQSGLISPLFAFSVSLFFFFFASSLNLLGLWHVWSDSPPETIQRHGWLLPPSLWSLLSCCLTSTEARWPIRDGDRVGRGRESERLDHGNRPKKTGETVDRRQNNGSVKAVSPRHCPATCALCNCCFNCCAGQSLRQCPLWS